MKPNHETVLVNITSAAIFALAMAAIGYAMVTPKDIHAQPVAGIPGQRSDPLEAADLAADLKYITGVEVVLQPVAIAAQQSENTQTAKELQRELSQWETLRVQMQSQLQAVSAP